MNLFIDSVLYSYAQIFFSNRRWFGAVVMAATFVVPQLGLAALLGVALSNFTAHILKFDEAKIRSGFYGFNGILFGAAAVFYFKLTFFLLVLVAIFIVITFLVSAVLEHHLASVFNLPGLSLPFVLTLYIFVVFLTNFDFIQHKPFGLIDYPFLGFLPSMAKMYFKSLGIIVFQSSILSGIVFAVAILFFSRVMFILSLIGFFVNYLFVGLLFQEQSEMVLILSGFNSILTAFALGGNLIIPSRKSLVLTVVASLTVVILTGFFMKALAPFQLPVLVLPFNFVVLSVLYSLKFRKDQSDLVLLYFQPGAPEENFYYHHNRLSRFERFKTVVPELPFFGTWRVSQGHRGTITHKEKWKHAWDFQVVDEKGAEYGNTGATLTDFYCYKLPVMAPLDGTIALVVDSVPNNEIGEANLKRNWGNTVVINHGSGLYSSVSHLEPFATKVKVGDVVRKGDIIGSCGNSGRSPTPHLHFQFQATDKLGDSTLEYPLGHYLEKRKESVTLHSFDIPTEGMLVQNIEAHKIIRQAFEFKLGDKLQFDYTAGNTSREEEWEVKVDMYNNTYIESSAGATVYVAMVGKVAYLTNFLGKRQSALYAFYLAALQVPLCYEPNLHWTDRYPISKLINNPVRYFSELFLVLSPQLSAEGTFSITERSPETKDFNLKSRISVKGSGLFFFYKKEWNGDLVVDAEGFIRQIQMTTPEGLTILVTAKTVEENQE